MYFTKAKGRLARKINLSRFSGYWVKIKLFEGRVFDIIPAGGSMISNGVLGSREDLDGGV